MVFDELSQLLGRRRRVAVCKDGERFDEAGCAA
jgi:hypothetical protein